MFWYIGGTTAEEAPGKPGNKIMDASMYIETNNGLLGGQTVTFTGTVTGNTLTTAHTSEAFIKDFAPDYSSSVSSTAPLVNGVFTISVATIDDPARHVQFGFQTIGVNAWVTDVAPFGGIERSVGV